MLVAVTRSCFGELRYSARLMLTVSDCAGNTVSVAVLVTPPAEAEMVTAVLVITANVLIVNAALAAPAGIVMEAGVDATDGLLLESVTI